MDIVQQRKHDHLQICFEKKQEIQHMHTAGFEHFHIRYHAFPSIDGNVLTTQVNLFHYELQLPLFISCMTGGGGKFTRIFNETLAHIAQESKIAMGLGSIRPLLENKKQKNEFLLRQYALDVPLFANIGIAQLLLYEHNYIMDVVRDIDADVLVIHINPIQEYIQDTGDICYSKMYGVLEQLCIHSSVPIIVKETGFGMSLDEIKALKACGVYAVDIAGAGGTNWALVEGIRQKNTAYYYASLQCASMGYRTAFLLAALQRSGIIYDIPIYSSGGIRTAFDIIISLILGAKMVGMAMPFVDLVYPYIKNNMINEGISVGCEFIEQLRIGMKTLLLSCGIVDSNELYHNPSLCYNDLYSEHIITQYMQ